MIVYIGSVRSSYIRYNVKKKYVGNYEFKVGKTVYKPKYRLSKLVSFMIYPEAAGELAEFERLEKRGHLFKRQFYRIILL